MTIRQRNLAIGATALLLALVLAVFLLPARQEVPPSASATTSGTSTTVRSVAPTVAASASPSAVSSPSATVAATTATSASATPSGSSAVSGRYGWIVIGGGGFALTDETGTTIQQYGCGAPGRPCDQTKVAVSPDGRRVAFWLSGQTPRWEVRIVDVSTPTSVRPVATLPDGFEGLGLAWATDSKGLLYSAQTVGYGGLTGGAGKATLTAIDVTTQAPAVDPMPPRTDGLFYRPVAWQRDRDVVAAVTTGEGGFVAEYATSASNGSAYKTTRVPAAQSMIATQVIATADATRVMGIDTNFNVVRIWPVGDFNAQIETGPGQGNSISGALWQALSVVWSFGDRLDVFVPQTSSSRNVFTSAGGVHLVALRPDGSGALVATTDGLLVIELANGGASRTSMARGQVVVSRGVLLR